MISKLQNLEKNPDLEPTSMGGMELDLSIHNFYFLFYVVKRVGLNLRDSQSPGLSEFLMNF